VFQGADWKEHFETRLSKELQRISGAKPTSTRGQAVLMAGVSVFEELLGQIERALASESSALSRELVATSSERRALERQLQIANEAAKDAGRTGRGRLLQVAAKPLAALLLAITGGVASGVGQEAWSQRTPATITANEWAAGCGSIVDVFVEHAVFGVHPVERQIAPVSRAQPDEDDSDAEERWSDFKDGDGQIQHPDFDPSSANAWEDSGLSPSVSVDWSSVGMDPDQAKEWTSEGFEPSEAQEWDSYGFAPTAASAWRYLDFTPDEAAQWEEQSFDPDEASSWRDYNFDVESAGDWRGLFESPEDAASWDDIDINDARRWDDAGFSAFEAAAWITAGKTPLQAAKLEGQGINADSMKSR
jgi:hypothetical protein